MNNISNFLSVGFGHIQQKGQAFITYSRKHYEEFSDNISMFIVVIKVTL